VAAAVVVVGVVVVTAAWRTSASASARMRGDKRLEGRRG
jgi:hypothetical protein